MNYRIVSKLLSYIFFSLGITFAFSLGIDLIESISPSREIYIQKWGTCIGIALLLSSALYGIGRNAKTKLFRNDGLIIIGTGWLGACLLGAVPYWILINNCSPVDAIFESTSGFTTTGASVFSHIENMSHGLLFYRCLSQWIGGLGVIVLFVAIMSSLGAGAKILYNREASANSADIGTHRIQSGVLNIFYLYTTLTVLCGIAYHLAGMTWFDAICHAFTTLSTGGFSTHSESIAYFKEADIQWISIIFMLIGGTSFIYILELISTAGRKYKNTEIAVYLIIVFSSTAILTGILVTSIDNITFPKAIRDSAFHILSIITTTGYATVDYDQWLPDAHIILLCLMAVGGCSGSTAGGIKVFRIIIALKTIYLELIKSHRPRIIKPLRLNNRALDDSTIITAINYILLVGASSFIAIPILSILEPSMSMDGIVSAYFASVFNIGPGFAEVGPTHTFYTLHSWTKLILSLLMILGRVEFYAILTLFMPSLWKKHI